MEQSVLRICRLLLLLTFWAATGLSGCYNPNIVNGGLHCSEGNRCPEGFVCHMPSSLCFRPDTGPPDVACTVTAPLCAEEPAPNQTCNPACQKGCSCGQRCNVSVSEMKSRCVPVGTKTLGQLCSNGNNTGSDDCAAGLICLAESPTCGPNVRRCYRLCTSDEQCKPADDVHCRIYVQSGTMDTGFRACDVPHQECDPVAKTGCPAGFTCYLHPNGQTLCDCPTNSASVKPADKPGSEGALCNIYSDCNAGLMCVSITGDGGVASPPACRPICVPGKTACAAGMTCKPNPAAPKFGYCTPL